MRTLPALRQEVQTLAFLASPLTMILADCRLGLKACLVCLMEWLTRQPMARPFPQTQQRYDISDPFGATEPDLYIPGPDRARVDGASRVAQSRQEWALEGGDWFRRAQMWFWSCMPRFRSLVKMRKQTTAA